MIGRIVLLAILKETKTTSADTKLYTRLGKHKMKHLLNNTICSLSNILQ